MRRSTALAARSPLARLRLSASLSLAVAMSLVGAIAQTLSQYDDPGAEPPAAQAPMPFDLRHVATTLDTRGGERARDAAFINPLNEPENVIGWIGGPESRAGDVTYSVKLARIENDGRYVAAFQFRMIDHEGIQQRARMIATVEGPDARILARDEIPVTGGIQVATLPIEAPMPGEFRLKLRCGGVRHFMGAAASCAYLVPAQVTPLTEADALAPYGVTDATLYVPPEGVFGEVQTGSSPLLINPSRDAQNALSWAVSGPTVHQCGVRWRFSAERNQGLVGRPLSLGLEMAFPVDTARLTLIGPGQRTVAQWVIYAGTDTRTLWFPTQLTEPGEYIVELIDAGVGRSECLLYRQLMINMLPEL